MSHEWRNTHERTTRRLRGMSAQEEESHLNGKNTTKGRISLSISRRRRKKSTFASTMRIQGSSFFFFTSRPIIVYSTPHPAPRIYATSPRHHRDQSLVVLYQDDKVPPSAGIRSEHPIRLDNLHKRPGYQTRFV